MAIRQDDFLPAFISDTFNAVHITGYGRLYLDLYGFTAPILCLRGYLKPGYIHQAFQPIDYLSCVYTS